MGKLFLMSDITLNPTTQIDSVFAELKDEFYKLDDVWEIEKVSENKVILTASLFKYAIELSTKNDKMIAKVRSSWVPKTYLYIFATFPFFFVPWTLYNLFFLHPKMEVANRRIDRILKDKFTNISTSIAS